MASVEWIATRGAAPKPGKGAELSLSLNPLPAADRLEFIVVEAYSDGTVVRWGSAGAACSDVARPGPVIEMVPGAASASDVDKANRTGPDDRTDGPAERFPLVVAGITLAALLAALVLSGIARRRPQTMPAASPAWAAGRESH